MTGGKPFDPLGPLSEGRSPRDSCKLERKLKGAIHLISETIEREG